MRYVYSSRKKERKSSRDRIKSGIYSLDVIRGRRERHRSSRRESAGKQSERLCCNVKRSAVKDVRHAHAANVGQSMKFDDARMLLQANHLICYCGNSNNPYRMIYFQVPNPPSSSTEEDLV